MVIHQTNTHLESSNKTLEQDMKYLQFFYQLWTYFTPSSIVSFVDFGQVITCCYIVP